VLVLLVRAVVFYYKDPLRRFPSPSIAGFSNFWAAYHSWFTRRTLAVDAAHAKLGPIIKIQPNHVSFNHPDAVQAIYGHGSVMLKDEFYDTFSSDEFKNIVGTRSREDHARKRKYIAAAFAQRHVVDMEPIVRGRVSLSVGLPSSSDESNGLLRFFPCRSGSSCPNLTVSPRTPQSPLPHLPSSTYAGG
jgi:cytochrome P450